LTPHLTPLLAAPPSLLTRLTLLPTRLVTRLLTFLLAWLLPVVPPALAGPVDWHEVPASSEGRQWWDAGSLRLSRGGNLSVLSRFQPASPEAEAAPRPRSSELYVMEIDCNQHLFRDTSVNGLPKLRAEWQPAGGDQLIDAVIEEACAAGQDLLA
jgi:hypothetical protein